jgi:diphthamide biosynthesis methyltransferase
VNSADFITKIQAETISASHELVSFDVKSLFTSIPLKLAIECMEESLANYDDELPIPKEEIIDLLKLCLESTFFQYNGSFYQQLHGTAMGSPVSVVVAEIVMQRLEERALSSYPNPPPFGFATSTIL